MVNRVIVRQKNLNQVIGEKEGSAYVSWKRRPSEIKGYQRALYYNEPNGNYLRVDYSIKSSRVRLYYEDNAEGNIIYSSIIEKGTIVSEKNMTSGRTASLSKVFTPLAPVISSIPNKEVLSLIGDNYGLASFNRDRKESEKRKKLEQTRQKYFKEDDDRNATMLGSFDESKKSTIVDLIDIMIGLSVAVALFFVFTGFQVPGMFMAVYGIGVGLVDIFIREREPIFYKIILFLVSGVGSYIYGYYFY